MHGGKGNGGNIKTVIRVNGSKNLPDFLTEAETR
jgi:hypothetical protein